MKQALDEANHTIDAYGLLMRLDEHLDAANRKLEQSRLEQNWPVMRQSEGIIHALTMVRRWITASLPHLKYSKKIPMEWRPSL